MKRLLALLLAAVALAGCSNDDAAQEFLVDNPGATPLTLSIDGKDIAVAANASTPVELSPGEHRLRSDRLGEVRFIVYARGKGGLINPTLSDYVIASEVYVTDESKLKNFGPAHRRIDLDGVQIEGPFEQTHALFIDKSWTFGVREPFPEVQTVAHVDSSGGRINTKIFTAADFIAYVEQNSGEPGAYARQKPGGYVQPAHALETAPAQLPPLHPDYEAHAAAMRDTYARYLKATRADQQLALQKEAMQAQIDFTNATVMLAHKLPTEANEAYNDFVHTRGRLMGSSVLVVP